ncbi:MAG TPA: extracellular solute-binding protein [Streptosporangiaceae bacterium]
MRSIRKRAAITLAATAALTLAACSSSGSSATSTSTGNKHVTLTWWNNATTGYLKTVWTQAAAAYHAAHPNVTIQSVPIQNEAFPTKVPAALAGNNPPDIYQQWGSGQEATQVPSGKLTDLTPYTSSWISQLGVAANAWQVNGKQYGVPYDLHTVGFWYRKDLFTKAGIASPPTTMTELNADVAKLKAAHIAPIAVGSKDKWPDAFWWEYFAVRECSTATLKAAIKADNLSAPCFVTAGNDLKSFMATNPFQTGFLGTAAQLGSGSSVGIVANGKAAMELQGDWDPGTMTPLTTDKNLNSQLGWFPFPSVPGGAGSPTTALGGGDGYSCTTGAAEPACADFLKYLDTPAVQAKVVAANVGLPANPAAASALTLPAMQSVQQYNQAAPFIQVYFDIAMPTNVGQTLDTAIANFFAGQATPQSIISTVNQAAKTQ